MKITIERSASHAETVAEMDRRGRVIEELETKNTSLKKMVQDAYNADFSEGMKEFTSNKGGIPWSESRFRRDVEK
jgi:hypothetical protein